MIVQELIAILNKVVLDDPDGANLTVMLGDNPSREDDLAKVCVNADPVNGKRVVLEVE